MRSIGLGHLGRKNKQELVAQSLLNMAQRPPNSVQSQHQWYHCNISNKLTDPSAIEAAASPIRPPFLACG
jgi:hypothetical protein